MSAPYSVIRFGSPDNNALAITLQNAIIEHFSQDHISAGAERTLTVSNRYFSAQVLLRNIDDGEPKVIVMEDGIILTFDGAPSHPDDSPAKIGYNFDSLASMHNLAEITGAGTLLRLCVGCTSSQLDATSLRGNDHEKEFSRRVLWCLDRGYEYIEADMSADGVRRGHGERDKDGFARVVEAISGTMWSSAVMTTATSRNLHESYKADLKEEGEVGENYVPPIPADLPPFFKMAGAIRDQTAHEALISQSGSIDDILSGPDEEGSQTYHESVHWKVLNDEKRLSDLETALREASRIRESSKSGSLSDEARRQRAGDAAILLMKLMGQTELDESEEESDSVDELGSADKDGDCGDCVDGVDETVGSDNFRSEE